MICQKKDLDLAYMQATLADVNICLGTTLQIVPAGNLPLKNKRYGGKTVICNLQPTKHDKKADILISTYVDTVLEKVCKFLGVEIPEYCPKVDPTKQIPCELEWTIPCGQVKVLEKVYNLKIRELNKKRKNLTNDASDNASSEFTKDIKKLMKKKKKDPICDETESVQT